jgi:hypothetical protein
VWLILQGCTVHSGPRSYRLLAQNDQQILVPPGVKDAGLRRRTFDFDTTAEGRNCDDRDVAVTLQPRRRGLHIAVDREALQEKPSGWLTQWATALEERGCIAPGEGFRLASSVAHALPLEWTNERRLLNPDARSSGYTDLRPGSRLRVVSPVFRSGTPPDAAVLQEESKVEASPGGLTVTAKASPDLIGYETAWYAVEPRPRGAGSRIAPQFAELHHEGEVERENAPRVNHLAFDPTMAYFRLLFMSRRTESNDHDIVVVAASTQTKLDQKTKALEAGTETCGTAARGSSDAETGPTALDTGGTSETVCTVAPKQVAIVAFLRVTVQGKEVLVHYGETLESALREAGADHAEETLGTLAVRKLYEGRLRPVEFSRASSDILALPLAGGEEIRW